MAKKLETKAKATEAVRKSFNLGNFKKKKGFSSSSVKFKEQKFIPLSQAFQDITSLPGIPTGHITLLRGHSDTGKTTALLEAAVNEMAQLPGIGKRTALRLVLHLLKQPKEQTVFLSNALTTFREEIKYCELSLALNLAMHRASPNNQNCKAEYASATLTLFVGGWSHLFHISRV